MNIGPRLKQWVRAPGGCQPNSAFKETALMRRFVPLAISIASIVSAFFAADVTYWP
jgi:hypothetical protein